MLLGEAAVLVVPPASFKVQSTDHCSVLRDLNFEAPPLRKSHLKDVNFVVGGGFLVLEIKFKVELVDLNQMLPSIILQNCRQEGLSEEEAGNPEDFWWLFIVYPLFQGLYS